MSGLSKSFTGSEGDEPRVLDSIDLLRRGFSASDDQHQLDAAIDYDSDSGQITIDASERSSVGT